MIVVLPTAAVDGPERFSVCPWPSAGVAPTPKARNTPPAASMQRGRLGLLVLMTLVSRAAGRTPPNAGSSAPRSRDMGSLGQRRMECVKQPRAVFPQIASFLESGRHCLDAARSGTGWVRRGRRAGRAIRTRRALLAAGAAGGAAVQANAMDAVVAADSDSPAANSSTRRGAQKGSALAMASEVCRLSWIPTTPIITRTASSSRGASAPTAIPNGTRTSASWSLFLHWRAGMSGKDDCGRLPIFASGDDVPEATVHDLRALAFSFRRLPPDAQW